MKTVKERYYPLGDGKNAAEDIDSMRISRSKAMANGTKYFELFEPDIPRGNPEHSELELLVTIGNLDCLYNIMRVNKNDTFCIIDTSINIESVHKVYDSEFNIIGISLDTYNKINNLDTYLKTKGLDDVNFKRIIMNPPYQRNLHLKILADAIKRLKDEESVCLNLSPIRWLQDPLAKEKKSTDYKRFEESISKHLTNVKIIDAKLANTIFGIHNFTDLAVYRCVKAAVCSYDYEHKLIDEYLGNRKSIFDKIFKFCKKSSLAGRIELNLKGISVKFNIHFGGHSNPYTLVSRNHSHPYIDGKTIDGRTYADCAFKKKDVDENKQEQSTIKFSSIIEAENFIKSVQTDFYMFVNSLTKRDVNISPMALPWMGDAINPRTGLKGYNSEWTDEDFYKFFNITSEEQKIIEETMAKYK